MLGKEWKGLVDGAPAEGILPEAFAMALRSRTVILPAASLVVYNFDRYETTRSIKDGSWGAAPSMLPIEC
jgi:hypothetical protein